MNPVVDIEKLGQRGVGIGHHEGKVVMVRLTAPGDRAEIRITKSHRSYDEAMLVRLLDPSPLRRDPPCPYFGRCGGCHLQHLEISHQRSLKAGLFREALSRGGGVPESTIGPLISTPEELEYRSRLELHARWSPKPDLGFLRLGSSQFIPVERCLLAAAPLDRSIHEIRRVLDAASPAPDIERVEICCDDWGNGTMAVLQVGRALPAGTRESPFPRVEAVDGLKGLYVRQGPFGKVLPLWESEPKERGVRYRIPVPGHPEPEAILEVWPGVFSQVNPGVNRLLVATAAAWTQELSASRILELYAGNGNLTIPLAGLSREVVAVEINPVAVENARANAARLSVGNVRWLQGPVAREMRRLSRAGENFDLVVLDPPRAGAQEVLADLLSLAPSAILYVSCDPATLARDIRLLRERGGYVAIRTRPLDMFPQTFHLESLTMLCRGSQRVGGA